MSPDAKTPRAPQAILFADITGSVGIYAERGDTVGFQISSRCLSLLGEQVLHHGGRVIKELGDAILAIHDDAADAVRAASAMMAAVRDPDSELGQEQVRIRVGLTFGGVVHDRDDIFGDVVNVASRLLGLARPDEILMTESVFEALPADLQASARSIDMLSIRGRPQPVKVYRYLWTAEEDTAQTTEGRGTQVEELLGSARLEVETDGSVLTVDQEHPKLRIGRGSQNEMVIDQDKVSRTHAEITFRANRFILADKSTNGTYLYPDAAAPIRLHREEVTLFGNGLIVLGTKSGATIVYRMVIGG